MNYLYSTNDLVADVSVSPIEGNDALSRKFDISFSALGYEGRCIHLPKKIFKNTQLTIVYELCDNKIHSFKRNKLWYESNNFRIVNIPIEELENSICHEVESRLTDKVSVFIDISSFTRLHLATFFSAFNYLTIHSKKELEITIGYSVASYTQSELDGPIIHSGPVNPDFAGWPRDPSLPTECIIGLGYEEGKALGVIEYIEPNSTWLFKPVGKDNRYSKEVDKANEDLYSFFDNTRLIDYRIDKPYSTFRALESLVSSYIDCSRPILIPLGPKLFFAISILVALRQSPFVSVWRVSSGKHAASTDKLASGEISFLHVKFMEKSHSL